MEFEVEGNKKDRMQFIGDDGNISAIDNQKSHDEIIGLNLQAKSTGGNRFGRNANLGEPSNIYGMTEDNKLKKRV